MSFAYDWVLFDADDTLFHFDAPLGLRTTFARHGIDFGEAEYAAYQAINRPLWVDYQHGRITATELKRRRFHDWAARIGIHPDELNAHFLASMVAACPPLDGVPALLDALRGRARLGIITNGFVDLQEARLQHTGLRDRFDVLVISEQVGKAKPHPDIFKHALREMGEPAPARVLMVGDNPHSDIAGAHAMGFDTCWYNPAALPRPEGIITRYEVVSHEALRGLLTAD
ncbi:pyrimidine 5'-nucleotidase [Luteimonas abyssi]|uniref:pyrimidine 5'-nucleotidase n=1 Tax=Luteimonas abyssi TaxID=1247514 RepID=UPI000737C18A|nr:pyrimidine 5'-nucleotidase [Luteimonas abyssi]